MGRTIAWTRACLGVPRGKTSVTSMCIQSHGRVHLRWPLFLCERGTHVVMPLLSGAAMKKLFCLVALIVVGCDSARNPISAPNRTGAPNASSDEQTQTLLEARSNFTTAKLPVHNYHPASAPTRTQWYNSRIRAEYEYRPVGLSTSTRSSQNKALHRSAQSVWFVRRHESSSSSVFVFVTHRNSTI
jgi:hypothetical protein